MTDDQTKFENVRVFEKVSRALVPMLKKSETSLPSVGYMIGYINPATLDQGKILNFQLHANIHIKV